MPSVFAFDIFSNIIKELQKYAGFVWVCLILVQDNLDRFIENIFETLKVHCLIMYISKAI